MLVVGVSGCLLFPSLLVLLGCFCRLGIVCLIGLVVLDICGFAVVFAMCFSFFSFCGAVGMLLRLIWLAMCCLRMIVCLVCLVVMSLLYFGFALLGFDGWWGCLVVMSLLARVWALL